MCKKHDVALENNASPKRLDINDVLARKAVAARIKIAINTDAHATSQLSYMELGVGQARRGWIEKKHVVNCFTTKKLIAWLKH